MLADFATEGETKRIDNNNFRLDLEPSQTHQNNLEKHQVLQLMHKNQIKVDLRLLLLTIICEND